MVDFSANMTAHTPRTASASAGGGQIKSVQAWKTKITAAASSIQHITPSEQQILANLEKAAQGRVGSFDIELETNLAYADAGRKIDSRTASEPKENFQFQDVVDVINPLHHIPVVSMVYRGLTGDRLHPVSQIIGGALYGGPVGAVAGTVNAISQVQTGKDLGDHALSFAGIENSGKKAIDKNNPEMQLNNIANTLTKNAPLENLPGSALSFVNLSEPNKAYQHIEIANGRTAGSMIVKSRMASYRTNINTDGIGKLSSNIPSRSDLEKLPAREEITSVNISALPPRQDT